MLVCGGVIPASDNEFLLTNGAAFVFHPGTKVTDAAVEIIDLLEAKKK